MLGRCLRVVTVVDTVEDARALARPNVVVGTDLLLGTEVALGTDMTGAATGRPTIAAVRSCGWDAPSVRANSTETAMRAMLRKVTSGASGEAGEPDSGGTDAYHMEGPAINLTFGRRSSVTGTRCQGSWKSGRSQTRSAR